MADTGIKSLELIPVATRPSLSLKRTTLADRIIEVCREEGLIIDLAGTGETWTITEFSEDLVEDLRNAIRYAD